MAIVVSTLSLTSVPGQNGGGSYALMSTWEAAEQTDLVADGDSHVLECYNDWPAGLDDSVLIADWVTGASNDITVRAATGEGHNGIEGAGFFLSHSNDNTIDIATSYVNLQNLEIVNTSTGAARALFVNATIMGVIERCIFTSKTSNSECVLLNEIIEEGIFRNSLLFGSSATNFNSTCRINGSLIVMSNVTVIGGGGNSQRGFAGNSSDSTLTNCIAFNNGNNDYEGLAGTTFINCASEDNTASGTGAITGVVEGDFKDFAGGDYTPSVGGVLENAGVDLSGDFTDDITGFTRG